MERKRRATCTISLAKKIALADELVPIRFEGEAEVHYVPFSELLNLDSSSPIEERTIGQVVMAPWESSCGHGHSRAVILSEEETSKGRKGTSGKPKTTKKASTGGKGEVAVPTDQVDMSPAKKKPKKGSVKSPKKNSPKRVKKPPSKEKARQSASIASNKHLVKLMIDRGTDTESSCSQDDRSARDQGNTTTRDPDVSDMAVISECQVVADERMDCDVDVQLLEVKKAVATPNRMKSPRRPEAKRKLPQKEKAQETSSVKASKIVDQGIYESDSDSNVHSKGADKMSHKGDDGQQHQQLYGTHVGVQQWLEEWSPSPSPVGRTISPGSHSIETWPGRQFPSPAVFKEPVPTVLRRSLSMPFAYSRHTPSWSKSPSVLSDQISMASSVSDTNPKAGQLLTAELKFVYDTWISPLQQQLGRIEELLGSIRVQDSEQSSVGHSWPGSVKVQDSEQSSVGHSWPGSVKVQDSEQSSVGHSSLGSVRVREASVGYPVPLSEESSQPQSLETAPRSGVYLGYAKHHKYKVYVTSISDLELRKIESSSSDAESLAKQLFMFLFKEELATRSEAICCTKNREDREILDQNILNGIRYHVHKEYPGGMKLMRAEEEGRWRQILKKLNSHIRYRRRACKPVVG